MRPARSGGAGWQMSLVEFLMSEYAYTLRRAIWGIPLTAAFALLAAHHVRHGHSDRPGFGDMAADAARAKAKAFFAANYTLV